MSAASGTTATKRSSFASALADLLDRTTLFTRAEWARFLGVSEPAISQWVNDKTIPRADVLSGILDVLRNSSDVPGAPLEAFDVVAGRPAASVSPLGQRMLPSVADYMREGTFEQLGRGLRELPTAQRIAVLTEGSWPKESQGEEALPQSTAQQRSAAADEKRSTGGRVHKPKGTLTRNVQGRRFIEQIRCNARSSRRYEAENRHACQ